MDLRRIRHFVVLAEALNFRRAAERLHMAQPPLSVSIQRLEAELDTKLFIREATGVSLTPSGRAVLVQARKLLVQSGQLAETARNAANGTAGTLRVGFVGTSTWGMLQRLVPAFRAEYPGVELVLREATSASLVQQVEDHGLDIGLVRTPLMISTIGTLVALEQDSFVVAMPSGHALADCGPFRLAELADEGFVMYAAGGAAGLHSAAMLACQEAGFLPRVTQEGVQVQTLLALVESGLGVALVPSVMQRYVSERIVYRPLVGVSSRAAIGLALLHMPQSESGAAARFCQLASHVIQTGAARCVDCAGGVS